MGRWEWWENDGYKRPRVALSAWGALTTFPCKFGPQIFSPPWGARAPPGPPMLFSEHKLILILDEIWLAAAAWWRRLRGLDKTFQNYVKTETRLRLRFWVWGRDQDWDVQDRDRGIFQDLMYKWTVGPYVCSRIPWWWPVQIIHLFFPTGTNIAQVLGIIRNPLTTFSAMKYNNCHWHEQCWNCE